MAKIGIFLISHEFQFHFGMFNTTICMDMQYKYNI